MRRSRALAWGLVGCGLASAGCSSSTSDSVAAKERLGTQRQSLGASKICQLIGDRDFQTGAATKSLTESLYGIHGEDLGYPMFDTTRNRVWFLFGDMFPSIGEDGSEVGPDSLGSTDVTLPYDSCPTLTFASSQVGTFQRLTLAGHTLNGFEAPTGGEYDATSDRFLAGFLVGGPTGQGILAQASVATPTSFTPIVDASDGADILADVDHFLLMSPALTVAAKVPHADELPSVPLGSDKVLLVFGTGAPYRQSAVYLAAVRLDLLDQRSAWRFFDGSPTMWSPNASAARGSSPSSRRILRPARRLRRIEPAAPAKCRSPTTCRSGSG